MIITAALMRANLEVLREAAQPLRGLNIDFDRLLEMIGESPCVFIVDPPESWHGGEPPETFPTGV